MSKITNREETDEYICYEIPGYIAIEAEASASLQPA